MPTQSEHLKEKLHESLSSFDSSTVTQESDLQIPQIQPKHNTA